MEFIDQNPQSFLHFGCWNNRNEKDGEDMDSVMNEIEKYINNDKILTPEFIVIAGDNYYPDKKTDEKGNKTKIIYTEKLKNGFEKLPKDIEIHMILGNHDLETNMGKPKLFVKDSKEEEKKEENCFILKNEQEIIEKIVNENPPGNIHLNLFHHKMLNHGTLLLMIDTSMYTLENEATDYLQCYNKFLSGLEIKDIDDLKNEQENFILETIKENKNNINHIIIVGHHPIIGVKSKKEKNKKKGGDNTIEVLDDIPNFLDVLEKIQIVKPDAKYYYLCADLHLYQHGKITITNNANNMTIQQYIVGTGGTKLDDEIPEGTITNHKRNNGNIGIFNIYKYNTNYELIESKCEHGFLECVITPNGPEFKFISVKEQSKIGGKKRRKTIRKKNVKRKSRNTRRPRH